jgi:alpha-D-ribose 1-methylphosphonate 5-triphosphate synthase subunit PhnG
MQQDGHGFASGAGPTVAPDTERQTAMALLARATPEELRRGLAVAEVPRDVADLRTPETGLVMVRGRMAGEGAPFNLGEATVTRAAVRLATGEVGFAYALGTNRERAKLAAIADALWQREAARDAINQHILRPVAARLAAEAARQAARAAATKVEFFTLVRGED